MPTIAELPMPWRAGAVLFTVSLAIIYLVAMLGSVVAVGPARSAMFNGFLVRVVAPLSSVVLRFSRVPGLIYLFFEHLAVDALRARGITPTLAWRLPGWGIGTLVSILGRAETMRASMQEEARRRLMKSRSAFIRVVPVLFAIWVFVPLLIWYADAAALSAILPERFRHNTVDKYYALERTLFPSVSWVGHTPEPPIIQPPVVPPPVAEPESDVSYGSSALLSPSPSPTATPTPSPTPPPAAQDIFYAARESGFSLYYMDRFTIRDENFEWLPVVPAASITGTTYSVDTTSEGVGIVRLRVRGDAPLIFEVGRLGQADDFSDMERRKRSLLKTGELEEFTSVESRMVQKRRHEWLKWKYIEKERGGERTTICRFFSRSDGQFWSVRYMAPTEIYEDVEPIFESMFDYLDLERRGG